MTRYLLFPTLPVFALGLGAGWALRGQDVRTEVQVQRCMTFAPSPEVPVCPDMIRIKPHGPGRAHDCIVPDSSGTLVMRRCP